jgi:hypothetical protein
MDRTQIYVVIREEIIANHILMHAVSVVVILALLFGTWLVERRSTVLSVLLPFLAITWAAGMLRFEFFIQRQGAYLRAFERQADPGYATWELWKAGFTPTKIVVPLADVFTVSVVFVTTAYLVFGPARYYLRDRNPGLARVFPWLVLGCLGVLMISWAIIPLVLQ